MQDSEARDRALVVVLDFSQDFLDVFGERLILRLQVRDRDHFASDRVIEIGRPGTVRSEIDLLALFHVTGFYRLETHRSRHR